MMRAAAGGVEESTRPGESAPLERSVGCSAAAATQMHSFPGATALL